MRLAIVSDVHANREAFAAVLADLGARGIDQIVLLGDLVGYGPDPEACVEMAADLVAKGALALRGNHDEAVGLRTSGFTTNAQIAIDWTRPRLSSAQIRFLTGLPMRLELGDLLLTHAAPQDPGAWVYLTSRASAAVALNASAARVTICGHVHVPQLYSMDRAGMVGEVGIAMGKALPLITSRRWVAVVGAVGQPRDGHPAAGFAIWDQARKEITFRRVPYDAGLTASKIRAAGLPEALARRLLAGR